MRVSETFTSRQGEGKLTGTESFFIRTSGCNLRCWFCDTPYASWEPTGDNDDVQGLVRQAVDSGLSHVVLTGGEPLLTPESESLCRELQAAGMHVTVETAGTVGRRVNADLMSISPKLAGSAPDLDKHARWHQLHQQRRMPIAAMRQLIDDSKNFQLKFVVDSADDYDEVLSVTSELLVDAAEVWIMPQGSTLEAMDEAIAWLKPWAESHGFRYCDRMQIRWFGNRRGT